MTANDLKRITQFGETRIFGSILTNKVSRINDIDIALILPSENYNSRYEELIEYLHENKLNNTVYYQNLLSYEKQSKHRKPSQFIHLLICNDEELNLNHPIISNVKRGKKIEVGNIS